jgi:catechol 2,3-dioxygenase-like lactoylglutathione lyase family enzyme
MEICELEHVNLRTPDLARAVAWYERVLGMRSGDKPKLSFPFAWMYSRAKPTVHIVEVKGITPIGNPTLEHFSFSAKGLKSFIERLEREKVAYEAIQVPGVNIQVNVHDPDGNHIHIDFDDAEGADVPPGVIKLFRDAGLRQSVTQ